MTDPTVINARVPENRCGAGISAFSAKSASVSCSSTSVPSSGGVCSFYLLGGITMLCHVLPFVPSAKSDWVWVRPSGPT
jgi:hypothetical protein